MKIIAGINFLQSQDQLTILILTEHWARILGSTTSSMGRFLGLTQEFRLRILGWTCANFDPRGRSHPHHLHPWPQVMEHMSQWPTLLNHFLAPSLTQKLSRRLINSPTSFCTYTITIQKLRLRKLIWQRPYSGIIFLFTLSFMKEIAIVQTVHHINVPYYNLVL